MGLAKSISCPGYQAEQGLERKAFLLCFIKELTDETSLSYTPESLGMPCLQPGTRLSFSLATHIPLKITSDTAVFLFPACHIPLHSLFIVSFLFIRLYPFSNS